MEDDKVLERVDSVDEPREGGVLLGTLLVECEEGEIGPAPSRFLFLNIESKSCQSCLSKSDTHLI